MSLRKERNALLTSLRQQQWQQFKSHQKLMPADTSLVELAANDHGSFESASVETRRGQPGASLGPATKRFDEFLDSDIDDGTLSHRVAASPQSHQMIESVMCESDGVSDWRSPSCIASGTASKFGSGSKNMTFDGHVRRRIIPTALLDELHAISSELMLEPQACTSSISATQAVSKSSR